MRHTVSEADIKALITEESWNTLAMSVGSGSAKELQGSSNGALRVRDRKGIVYVGRSDDAGIKTAVGVYNNLP
jgi:hypothetical protein